MTEWKIIRINGIPDLEHIPCERFCIPRHGLQWYCMRCTAVAPGDLIEIVKNLRRLKWKLKLDE